MTPVQILSAIKYDHKVTLESLKLDAKKFNGSHKLGLSCVYADGLLGVEKNIKKSFFWALEAYEDKKEIDYFSKGIIVYNLAMKHVNGLAENCSLKTASDLLTEAAITFNNYLAYVEMLNLIKKGLFAYHRDRGNIYQYETKKSIAYRDYLEKTTVM